MSKLIQHIYIYSEASWTAHKPVYPDAMDKFFQVSNMKVSS